MHTNAHFGGLVIENTPDAQTDHYESSSKFIGIPTHPNIITDSNVVEC